MKQRSKKKLFKNKLRAVLCIFLAFSVFIIINDFGLIKLVGLKREQHGIERKIHQLMNQQIKLNNEIDKLKNNSKYIEKIAREKFMMVKPGEKIFRVIEYKEIQ